MGHGASFREGKKIKRTAKIRKCVAKTDVLSSKESNVKRKCAVIVSCHSSQCALSKTHRRDDNCAMDNVSEEKEIKLFAPTQLTLIARARSRFHQGILARQLYQPNFQRQTAFYSLHFVEPKPLVYSQGDQQNGAFPTVGGSYSDFLKYQSALRF